jgi:hypothetical protein
VSLRALILLGDWKKWPFATQSRRADRHQTRAKAIATNFADPVATQASFDASPFGEPTGTASGRQNRTNAKPAHPSATIRPMTYTTVKVTPESPTTAQTPLKASGSSN